MQPPESTEERQIGIELIKWETKTISLKYLKLGKSRKKLKWLMNISAANNKYRKGLQNSKPMGLEKVGDGEWRMEFELTEWRSGWDKTEQVSK